LTTTWLRQQVQDNRQEVLLPSNMDDDKTKEAHIESNYPPPRRKYKTPLPWGYTQYQLGRGGDITPPETRRLLTKSTLLSKFNV